MTQPPNSKEEKFPLFALFFLPLLPFGFAAFAYLISQSNYQFDSVRIALEFIIWFTIFLAFVLSLFVLPKAITKLKSKRTDRTAINYLATAFAIAFDLIFLFCVIWIIYKFLFAANLKNVLYGQHITSLIA
jgi:hypothetical protein